MTSGLAAQESAPAVSLAEAARLGFQHLDAGRFGQAEQLLRAVHGAAGPGFDLNRGLGICLAARGDYNGAIPLLRDAATLRDDPLTYNVLGVCCFGLGRYEHAVACADEALKLAPGFTEALSNRGNALNRLGRYAEAAEALQAALARDPNDAELHTNLANPLRELGRREEALAHLDRALSLTPSAVAHTNRGNVLQDLARHGEAVEAYDRAIALDPRSVDAQWNRALCCLLLGRAEEGWRGYEWRWRRGSIENTPRDFAAPLWLGETDLTGRSILLHCEQGMGDSIQFVRYARRVAERGAKVVLEAYPPLMELFGSIPGVAEIVARGAPLPATDFQCPLMSLPLALGPEAAAPDGFGAYLRASGERGQVWRERLGERTRPRIGVVNRGRPTHGNDHRRSLPLALLAEALPAGADYHVLLKDGTDDDRAFAEVRADLTAWDGTVGDFADMAALWSLMDVVISIDSGPAHLAGALGQPTWILTPYDPDWRWGLGSDRTAWYPSAALYRQTARDDWTSPLARLQGDLAALIRAEA